MLIVSVIISVFIDVNFVVIQNVSASLCSPVPFAPKSGGRVPPAPIGAPPMATAACVQASFGRYVRLRCWTVNHFAADLVKPVHFAILV